MVAIEDQLATAIRSSETDPTGACGPDGVWCGGGAVDGAQFIDAWKDVGNPTPPSIVPHFDGPLGNDGWYTGALTVTWDVTDPESAISQTHDCDATAVDTDTDGTTLTCSATSVGGTGRDTVIVKRDATAPVVSVTNVVDGATYDYGLVPVADCSTTDALSGVATAATALLSGGPLGNVLVTCAGARDDAGNAGFATVSYTVIGGSQVVEDVYADLDALSPADEHTAHWIDHALKSLDRSLEAKLWLDPLHPSAEHGNETFDRQRDAVRELMHLKNPDETVAVSIARLVEQARLLAVIAIGDAAGGKADHLEHAAEARARGDAERAGGHYDKAIDHFGHAW
jgi:hypothetical protein